MNSSTSYDTFPSRVPTAQFFQSLADLLRHPGPFLSCYLPTSTPADLEAGRTLIADAELTSGERAFLETALTEASPAPEGSAMMVAFRSDDGATYVQHYPEPPMFPVLEKGDIPRLAPIISAEQRLRHHVMGVISDDGIDVIAFPQHGEPSIRHLNETALEGRVAGLLEAINSTDTRLVILAGAPDVVAELSEPLLVAVPIETKVECIPTSGENIDVDATAQAAVTSVANDRAVATMNTLKEWHFERSIGDAAADVVTTVEALRSGEARMLLVHDDVNDQRQLWVGSDARAIATDLEDSQNIKPPADADADFAPVGLVDGLIRSALLQDIAVRIIPTLPEETMPGGVGVLRDAAATTTLPNP